MKNYALKSLEKLKLELYTLDSNLVILKKERAVEIEKKETELDEKFADSPDSEQTMSLKECLLDQYKEELNEVLGINKIREDRRELKAVIDDKEKEQDSQTNVNYM